MNCGWGTEELIAGASGIVVGLLIGVLELVSLSNSGEDAFSARAPCTEVGSGRMPASSGTELSWVETSGVGKSGVEVSCSEESSSRRTNGGASFLIKTSLQLR